MWVAHSARSDGGDQNRAPLIEHVVLDRVITPAHGEPNLLSVGCSFTGKIGEEIALHRIGGFSGKSRGSDDSDSDGGGQDQRAHNLP